VEPMHAADGRVRYRRRRAAEPLDGQLERLAADPRSVLGAARGSD